VLQTRRAEAARLIALGQLELDSHPTRALAWARASLGLADTQDGRMFALQSLSKGPVAQYLSLSRETEGVVHSGEFSPDGEWIALQGYSRVKAEHRSGGPLAFVDNFPTSGFRTMWPVFDASSRRLSAWYKGEIRTYLVPDFAEAARTESGAERVGWLGGATARGFYEVAPIDDKFEIRLRSFEGDPTIIGRIEPCKNFYFDPGGSWFVCSRGGDVFLHSLEDPGAGPRRLARLDGNIGRIRAHPLLEWIAAEKEDTDTIIVWPLGKETREPLRTFNTRGFKFHDTNQQFMIEPQGNRIAIGGIFEGKGVAFIWDLRSPIGADPLVIRSGTGSNGVTFDPSGQWLATGQVGTLRFWPLPSKPTLVFPGDGEFIQGLAFTSDAGALLTSGWGGVHLQPLTGNNEERRRLYDPAGFPQVRVDPQDRFAIISDTFSAQAVVLPLDGSDPITRLKGFSAETMVSALAYDPDRGLVAAATHRGPRNQKVIRVWNLQDESVQVLGPTDDAGDDFVGAYFCLEFLPDGSLLSSGHGGIRRWNIEEKSFEVVFDGNTRFMGISPDGRTVATIVKPDDALVIIDLESGTLRQHPFQGSFVTCEFSPDGDVIAAGMANGVIQIGRLSGGQPHLLIGHDGPFHDPTKFAFSPDGRRLASGDESGTVRVWPVPDLSKPPLYTLAHGELLTKLDSLTNLRMVPDKESSTGYSFEFGPFPGWANVPEW
jgi:WD40 repeat protein